MIFAVVAFILVFFLFQECGKFSSRVASTLFKHILLREEKSITDFKMFTAFSIIDKKVKNSVFSIREEKNGKKRFCTEQITNQIT